MSIHQSLKRKRGSSAVRSVMTRDERIAQMMSEDRWTEGMSVFGIPKTKVVRITIGKKKKKVKEEGDAKDAKGAKGGKAAPAKGAAAPAAKGAAAAPAAKAAAPAKKK